MSSSHSPSEAKPRRFIGLDIHKKFLMAAGVDAEQNQVLPFQKVTWWSFDAWVEKHLTPQDAVVIEMTTNTWTVYDRLVEKVHSVTVVHPPHVSLITRARVMNDRKAALALAQLLAAGLLVGIWVPPDDVRDLRLLTAERYKMVQLANKAKTRLHNLLHRHHWITPPGSQPFHPKHREFWLGLGKTPAEKITARCDWETLEFASRQIKLIEGILAEIAAQDPRVPLLVQLPGIAMLGAVTILGAIGEIERFPTPKHLVGYAGMGARVHDSGESRWRGGITKSGRKDLRFAMVQAASHAVRHHPYWKWEFAQLERRMERPKALVAIGRRMLVVVWHLLTGEARDRRADARMVAASFYKLAYEVGVRNLPDGQSALQFTRSQMDRLKIGRELTHIPWGTRQPKLPPSRLPT